MDRRQVHVPTRSWIIRIKYWCMYMTTHSNPNSNPNPNPNPNPGLNSNPNRNPDSPFGLLCCRWSLTIVSGFPFDLWAHPLGRHSFALVSPRTDVGEILRGRVYNTCSCRSAYLLVGKDHEADKWKYIIVPKRWVRIISNPHLINEAVFIGAFFFLAENPRLICLGVNKIRIILPMLMNISMIITQTVHVRKCEMLIIIKITRLHDVLLSGAKNRSQSLHGNLLTEWTRVL